MELIRRAGPKHDDETAEEHATRVDRASEEAKTAADYLRRTMRLEIMDKIEVFAKDCNAEEYTDTEEVWDIFYDIYELLGGDCLKLSAEGGKTRQGTQDSLLGLLEQMIEAGALVVDRWESGDLAGAVRNLADVTEKCSGQPQ